ncbi:MAG: YeiH family protein [Propionivibrio sp.]
MVKNNGVFSGVLLVVAIAAAAWGFIQWEGLRQYGVSSLTLAILIGAVLGNIAPTLGKGRFRPGLVFAQRRFLRAGVALYGFNLSVQQIVQVGSTGILVDLVMVTSTLLVGWTLGRRLLGMDRETVLLASAGSAICGAAAVVATVPMLPSDRGAVAEKSAVAVATVVLFGTLAMLLYPAIHIWVGDGIFDFGVYVGSTVHEVAQVVAIGSSIGEDVAGSAVIVKMIRVMLLVPFLITVGLFFGDRGTSGEKRSVPIPWFAVMFVVLAGVNSLHILPVPVVDALRLAGVLLLTVAMASLGIDTNLARMGQAGVKPLLLGAGLFVHLVFTGGLVNWLAA